MKFPDKLYCYRAKLIRCVDGDTIWLEIDHGFHTFSRRSVRLARINTPEIRGEEKEEGLKAMFFVEDVLLNCSQIVVQSSNIDNFGRAIGEVWADQNNLSDLLVQEKLAIFKEY